MTPQDRQEAISLAYVAAVAADAGLTVSTRKDYGFDLTLHEIAAVNGGFRETGFALDVQVKSTTTARLAADDVSFRLDRKNYDDLRQTGQLVPRLLVLVVLPAEERWVIQADDRLAIVGTAYWASLRGEPVAVATGGKVTIRVSRRNLFTAAGIRGIIAEERARRRIT